MSYEMLRIVMSAKWRVWLWYVYIFLRFVFRRAVLLRRMKRFANEHNIECSITASAFLLPSNRFGTALLLKTQDKTYNIRLFAAMAW